MLEMFDCKGPQKLLIATICSKARSGVLKPLMTESCLNCYKPSIAQPLWILDFTTAPPAKSNVQLLFHLQCCFKRKISLCYKFLCSCWWKRSTVNRYNEQQKDRTIGTEQFASRVYDCLGHAGTFCTFLAWKTALCRSKSLLPIYSGWQKAPAE